MAWKYVMNLDWTLPLKTEYHAGGPIRMTVQGVPRPILECIMQNRIPGNRLTTLRALPFVASVTEEQIP